jgi:hypothetical protein
MGNPARNDVHATQPRVKKQRGKTTMAGCKIYSN